MTELIDRKQAVRDSKARQYVRQRLQNAANSFSKRGDVKAKVELLNEALCNFIRKVYERDPEAGWLYIDPRTYRILLAKPWGDSGWRYSNLRRAEARVLSKILLNRVRKAEQPVLFDYNFASHEWYLNLAQFRSEASALAYVERLPVTVKEWRSVAG